MSVLLYVPYSAFGRNDIESLVKLCLSEDVRRVDTHGGRQVTIKYLLYLHALGFDLSPYINLNELPRLKQKYDKLKQIDIFKGEFDVNHDQTFEPYWELNSNSHKIHQLAKYARHFTNKKVGFLPEQLKVYFNSKQIENIPFSHATFDSTGFVDTDVRNNMFKYPIHQRSNKGQINTKRGKIEQVIFDIPSGKQVIILDFADDRMPGG
jgi:hypothetical protein